MKKTVDCIIILTILMISSVCLAASAKEIYFNGDKIIFNMIAGWEEFGM